MIRYILLVYNSCLRVVALICCEGFKWFLCCSLLQKFDLIFGALWFVIFRVRNDWVVDNYFVYVIRIITLYVEIIIFRHAKGVEVVII